MKQTYKKILITLLLFLTTIFVHNFVFAADPQFSLKVIYLPQCMDNRDNDGDGRIDFPEDQDCTSPQDDDEDSHGGNSISSSIIVIEGKTIPNAKIKILKDGKILIYTKSDNEGNFSQNVYGFYYGNYSFGIIAEAKDKESTNIVNFNLDLKPGNYISVSSVYVSPTIGLSGNLKIGEDLFVEGYGLANSDMQIILYNKAEQKENILSTIKTDKHGYYSFKFNTKNTKEGDYLIRSKNIIEENVIGTSKYLDITLSKTNEEINNSENYKHKVRCDLNGDDNVDLVDFSILLFYWLKNNYPEGDFNSDKIVDIKDFSIMAYNWTGD